MKLHFNQILVEDTRQKENKHDNKHKYWDAHNIEWIRNVLPFGDYWLVPHEALNDDADLNEYIPLVAVDTKQDVQEVAANMCGASKEKKRFREECKRAQEAGCKLIFLIEDSRFHTPEDLYGRKIWLHNRQIIPGDQLVLAMRIHEERYGCEFWFCDPEESGRVIKELLE